LPESYRIAPGGLHLLQPGFIPFYGHARTSANRLQASDETTKLAKNRAMEMSADAVGE